MKAAGQRTDGGKLVMVVGVALVEKEKVLVVVLTMVITVGGGKWW